VSGAHDGEEDVELSPVLVDAVHRIATDSGRLTQRWHADVIAAGVSEGELVEAISVIGVVVAIDTLTRSLGHPPLPLSEPQSGTPSRLAPSGAEVDCAWVPTVAPAKAEGEVARYYEESLAAVGFVANMQRPLTLVPDEQLAYIRLSRPMYHPGRNAEWNRAITPQQGELLGATVSAENECFY
jgi:hypothetical protein